jgi:LysM repeat protein
MRLKVLISTLVLMSVIAGLAIVPAAQAQDFSVISCTTWHTVQRGDTMYRVALRYGTSVANIQRWNNIANANLIYVGQPLCVNAIGGGSGNPGNPGGTRHIVQPGDRLARIAQRYGVDMWVLARVNNITNVNLIYVGQSLIIPDVTIQ